MQSTQRKRFLLLGALVSAAVILCVFWLRRPSEPVYRGHTLTYWMTCKLSPHWPVSQSEEVRAALEYIGTNHTPFLIKWLREPNPSYAEPGYIKQLNRLFALQHFIDVRFSHHWGPSHRAMAFQILTEIPPAARAAIPLLIPMLSDPDEEKAGVACMILTKAGSASIGPLTFVLASTNEVARALAAGALGQIGADAKPLMPALQKMLQDPKLYVRLSAAKALTQLGADADPLIPVLLQGFHEGDTDSSVYALEVLGELKGRAKAAVPELIAAFARAREEGDRFLVLHALEQIDAEAATKAKAQRAGQTKSPPAFEAGAAAR